MKRKERIQEIYKHGQALKTNMTTLVFFLAMATDKEVASFHKEFLTKGTPKKK